MTHRDILRRAAEGLGGAERLAAFLDVAPAELRAWMAGKRVPPDEMVTAAFDVLAEGALEMARRRHS